MKIQSKIALLLAGIIAFGAFSMNAVPTPSVKGKLFNTRGDYWVVFSPVDNTVRFVQTESGDESVYVENDTYSIVGNTVKFAGHPKFNGTITPAGIKNKNGKTQKLIKWTLENGTYNIVDAEGRYLTYRGFDAHRLFFEPGSADNSAQLWVITNNADGSVTFSPQNDQRMALDLNDCNAEEGKIHVWEKNGCCAQNYMLIPDWGADSYWIVSTCNSDYGLTSAYDGDYMNLEYLSKFQQFKFIKR